MLHAAGIDGFTRALIVSAISTCVGYCGAAVLGSSRRGLRLLGWTLALACFFSPPLLVGYVYSNFTPVGLASEGMRNLFYGVLLSARIVPVAAVVWMMCPGRVTREAWHCLHLLWPSLGSGERIRHVWHMLRRGLPASAVVVFGHPVFRAFQSQSRYRPPSPCGRLP